MGSTSIATSVKTLAGEEARNSVTKGMHLCDGSLKVSEKILWNGWHWKILINVNIRPTTFTTPIVAYVPIRNSLFVLERRK